MIVNVMSQLHPFILIKNNQRRSSYRTALRNVHTAIWHDCESELDIDVRFPAPTERKLLTVL